MWLYRKVPPGCERNRYHEPGPVVLGQMLDPKESEHKVENINIPVLESCNSPCGCSHKDVLALLHLLRALRILNGGDSQSVVRGNPEGAGDYFRGLQGQNYFHSNIMMLFAFITGLAFALMEESNSG